MTPQARPGPGPVRVTGTMPVCGPWPSLHASGIRPRRAPTGTGITGMIMMVSLRSLGARLQHCRRGGLSTVRLPVSRAAARPARAALNSRQAASEPAGPAPAADVTVSES